MIASSIFGLEGDAVGSTTVQARNPSIRETAIRHVKISAESHNSRTGKKFVRRDDRDSSQHIRLGIQVFFLIVNLWIGFQFYLFVRWAENGGRTPAISRPAGVEGWLPIEGMMQFKYAMVTKQLPALHPAAFFLFRRFRTQLPIVQKVVLWLAVPDRDYFLVSLEIGTPHLRP